MPETIFRYFPELSPLQKERFLSLKSIYGRWNNMINIISRKDFDNFIVHHVLHSLSIAKIISFSRGTTVLDVGSGGGLPGIPLAILFPDTQFTLLDSIEKKTRVISSITEETGLDNVKVVRKRMEDENGKYDFITGRAVTKFNEFVTLTRKNISETENNELKNGIIYLKGGDIDKEIESFRGKTSVWNISDFFSEPYFATKKIIYLPC